MCVLRRRAQHRVNRVGGLRQGRCAELRRAELDVGQVRGRPEYGTAAAVHGQRSMSSDLHRAAQLGAGVLVSAGFLSIGLVLVFGLYDKPAAWGGALMLTGASYGVAILCVVRGRPLRDAQQEETAGTSQHGAAADDRPQAGDRG